VVLIPQPHGEIVDRLVILGLKCSRLADPDARQAAERLRDAIAACWDDAGLPPPATLPDYPALLAVNAELWDVESAIRQHAPAGGVANITAFLALAQRVPELNDRRSALKAAIDRRLGGTLSEPKSYR
jgi:hypothetical protein